LIFPARLYNPIEVKVFNDTNSEEGHTTWLEPNKNDRNTMFHENPSYYLFLRYRIIDMRCNVLWKYTTKTARVPSLFDWLYRYFYACQRLRMEWDQQKIERGAFVLFPGKNRLSCRGFPDIITGDREMVIRIEEGKGEPNQLGHIEPYCDDDDWKMDDPSSDEEMN
jgi:hypothetical protein